MCRRSRPTWCWAFDLCVAVLRVAAERLAAWVPAPAQYTQPQEVVSVKVELAVAEEQQVLTAPATAEVLVRPLL